MTEANQKQPGDISSAQQKDVKQRDIVSHHIYILFKKANWFVIGSNLLAHKQFLYFF